MHLLEPTVTPAPLAGLDPMIEPLHVPDTHHAVDIVMANHKVIVLNCRVDYGNPAHEPDDRPLMVPRAACLGNCPSAVSLRQAAMALASDIKRAFPDAWPTVFARLDGRQVTVARLQRQQRRLPESLSSLLLLA